MAWDGVDGDINQIHWDYTPFQNIMNFLEVNFVVAYL